MFYVGGGYGQFHSRYVKSTNVCRRVSYISSLFHFSKSDGHLDVYLGYLKKV